MTAVFKGQGTGTPNVCKQSSRSVGTLNDEPAVLKLSVLHLSITPTESHKF